MSIERGGSGVDVGVGERPRPRSWVLRWAVVFFVGARARFGSWWAVVVRGWLWWAFLVDGRLSWVGGDRLRMVRVVARGRRHRLGPFMAGGRPGAVVVGRPGLLAMVW